MPCTVENCANWATNSLLDSGFSGSWLASCWVISRMKSAWPSVSAFFAVVAVPVVLVLIAAKGSPLTVVMCVFAQSAGRQRPMVRVARASSLAVFSTSTPAW